MEPAPGWLALVTGLVGCALAPLPVRGLVVESVVGGSRLVLLPPVNGLGVTGLCLRTATGLADFAPVRGLNVTSRGLLTATGLVGPAFAMTGLGLRTATGLGVSVHVPMVTKGLAVPIADSVTACGDLTGPLFRAVTGKKSAIQT